MSMYNPILTASAIPECWYKCTKGLMIAMLIEAEIIVRIVGVHISFIAKKTLIITIETIAANIPIE